MAQNTALEHQARLQQLQSQAQQPLQHTHQVDTARQFLQKHGSTSDKTAAFAYPEAAATALASSFILGPVGGAVLGLAQGILGKQARQASMDSATQQRNALTEALDVTRNELTSFYESASNPYDIDQIERMQATLRVAESYMKSPTTEGLAATQINNLQNDMASFVRSQETDRVAREEFAYQNGQTALNRFDSNLSEYDDASKGFREATGTVDLILESIEAGTPLDQAFALTKFQTIVDNLGQVRDEDVAKWGGQEGSVMEQLEGYLSKLATGEELTPAEQRNLQDTVLRIRSNIVKQQRQTDLRYLNEGEIFKFSDKMLDNFTLSSDYIPYEPTLIEPGTGPVGEVAQAVQESASMTAGDYVDNEINKINTRMTAAGIAGDMLLDEVKERAETVGDFLKERYDVTQEYWTND